MCFSREFDRLGDTNILMGSDVGEQMNGPVSYYSL